MRILLWHVHGSWTTAFVQGHHDYVVPVTPQRDADGLGRARTWDWPANVIERTPEQLAHEDIDIVVLQRPSELDLTQRWLGRRPGRDVPAVYLEHNAPEPHPVHSVHPLARGGDITIVHVTHFNRLFWDNGRARTTVIEHGIVDPGQLYTGEVPHAGVVINEPIRRGRIVGTDLLPHLAQAVPIEMFGMRAAGVVAQRHHNLPQAEMHRTLARLRMYVHPVRWTSLGLSLLEAMHLGMPIVAIAATEVVQAVPSDAGVISTDVDRLVQAARTFVNEPEVAHIAGRAARQAAVDRYGLARFLADWDRELAEVMR